MISSSRKSNSSLIKLFIILMALLLSFTFLAFPSYAVNGNHNDGTSDGDGNNDKVDGGTIGGGGSHTAANTGEAVKGDEGFRLYLIGM